MPDANGPYTTPQDFLNRMDLGHFDRRLHEEVEKLTREQLEEVAHLLIERQTRGFEK